METIRLTPEIAQALVGLGYEIPVKKKRVIVHNVTLDSRFTDDELVGIYSTIGQLEKSPKWRLKCMLVRFALGTGLRESEITRVRFSMDAGKDREADAHWNGVVTVRNGKGGKSRDACCIPELLPHYQAFITEQRARITEAPKDGLVPLFGKEYDRTTLWRWWKKVLAQCPEVRSLDFHAARRTYFSWEALRLPVSTLKGLGGHSQSSDTFEKHYNGVIAELAYGGEIKWRKVALRSRS